MLMKLTVLPPVNAPRNSKPGELYLASENLKAFNEGGVWMDGTCRVVYTAFGPFLVDETIDDLRQMWAQAHPEEKGQIIEAPAKTFVQ